VAKTAAPYVAAVVAPGVVVTAALAQEAADTWGDDIRAGADAVGQTLKGAACTALGDTVGPCIDMYLPKPENNEKGFARLSGQADITVPLQGVGVPCNVKMGKSASVTVDRTSSGYGVSVDGEAFVFANLAAGKEGVKAEVKVDMPTGGSATAWERLGGGKQPPVPGAGPGTATPGGTPGTPAPAPAPGAPAPAQGAPAAGPQDAGGAGLSGEVEGGVKAAGSLKFAFAADSSKTSCEGAGGVAALLGALGVSASLPAPLDVLARSGVAGSWEGNLVSNTVTVSLAAGGQVELSKDGLGALKGSGQAEAYATTGVERKDVNDSLRPTLKVGAGLKGELAGELAIPKLGLAKGAVSGTGKVEAALMFDKPNDRIALQSVTAEAEVGLAVGGINPAMIASAVGPPFGPAAAAKINSLGLAHSNGSVSAKVFGKADNLQKYIDAADAYLSGNPESVTAGGLVKAVGDVYNEKDFSSGVTITAIVSDRVAGVDAKAEEIGGEGAKAGVSAKASLDVGTEYTLYP
jgi:hypothetical protein